MDFLRLSTGDGIAEARLERGKVNALNDQVVQELSTCLRELAVDPAVRATILTGTGKFFSFGFDIPEFLAYSRAEFTRYLTAFAGLYREMFLHPQPLVAALNGHAVAGGCMLATACDARLMADGKGKIGLNEIGFGSSVFAGSVQLLAYWLGERRAQEVLFSGKLHAPSEALAIGLVDAVVGEAELAGEARRVAGALAAKDPAAFRSIKGLLRRPVVEAMLSREAASIAEFVDLWYSPQTWKNLQGITIRG